MFNTNGNFTLLKHSLFSLLLLLCVVKWSHDAKNTLGNIRETVQENTPKKNRWRNLNSISSCLMKLGVLIIIQPCRPALIFNIATYLNKICSFYCSSCSKCPTWSTCCLAFCGNYCAWEKKWALKKAVILAGLLHRLVFAVHTGFFWKLLSGLSTESDHTRIKIKTWE